MENKRLYGKLCFLHRQMSRENNRLFAEFDLTPVQMNVLFHIYVKMREGQKMNQKDIEKFVNLRASSVSSLITNLENDGFLTRTLTDGNKRAKYLELTEKGKLVCVKNSMLFDECDSAIQSALSADEQETFEALLQKIIDSISK